MKKSKAVRIIFAIAILGAALLLASCAPAAPTAAPAPTSAAPAATTAPAATAAPAATSAPSNTATPAVKTPTGSLTIALSTFEAETFLPWNGGIARQSYMLMIYDTLVYTDPKTEEQKPGLATSWTMSSDAKTWTLQLRKGVQFQEGNGEMTSDDVKFSLERMIAPDSIGSPAGQLRSLIASVDAPDPYTVVINLKTPYPELVRGFLNDGNAAGVIVSKKYVTAVGNDMANAHPIGTGPYTLSEPHQKGGPIKLTTVPDVGKNWRVTPDYKDVTFLLVPEEATRVAMLKRGEADLAPISYDSIDSIKSSGLNVISLQKTWTPLIWLGGLVTTDPKRTDAKNPWADKRVRQALNYAIDRDAIAKNIFKGEATPAAAPNPLAPWLDIQPYPYDPTKAKQLLADAGFANGFPITLKTFTTNPGAELPVIGEAVALYWKAIGVDIKIEPSDFANVRADLLASKANGYAFVQRGQPFLEPLTPLNLWYDPNQPFTSYDTDASVAAMKVLAAEPDSKKRDQLAHDLTQTMRDDASGIFIVNANEVYGASKKIGTWNTIRMRPQNIESITRP